MRRSSLLFARQKRRVPTAHKATIQPEKTKARKKQKPLIQSTVSPWVWASGDVEQEETQHFSGPGVRQAGRYFELHGPNSRFVPPSEFSYELPSQGIPEIAFAGRSNVGKSSLLAALLDRKQIVRTSKTPGCTASVNYFALGEGNSKNNTLHESEFIDTAMDEEIPSSPPSLMKKSAKNNVSKASHDAYLVDLPGYGFAKVSKKDQKQWSLFMTDFLSKRGFMTLRRVLVLIDSRRGPTPEDWRLMEVLSDANVTFQLVLTKADTVSLLEQQARVMQLFSELGKWKLVRPTHMPFIHVTSTKAPYSGLDELRLSLTQAACIDLTK